MPCLNVSWLVAGLKSSTCGWVGHNNTERPFGSAVYDCLLTCAKFSTRNRSYLRLHGISRSPLVVIRRNTLLVLGPLSGAPWRRHPPHTQKPSQTQNTTAHDSKSKTTISVGGIGSFLARCAMHNTTSATTPGARRKRVP